MTAEAVDGRVLRGERNRRAIVDALVELYRSGTLRPTTRDVAERAGVSARSVFHHFADMESLAAEVAERQLRDYEHLMEARPPEGDRGARVAQLVAQRAELFRAISPVRRAALLQVDRNATIARNLAALTRRLRRQVEQTFAPELDRLSGATRGDVLDVLDALTSWETWERLRSVQRVTEPRARQAVERALHAVLSVREAPGGS